MVQISCFERARLDFSRSDFTIHLYVCVLCAHFLNSRIYVTR